MLLTPQGKLANKIDRIMLLSIWATKIQEESLEKSLCDEHKVIIAGIGKPTFPINEFLAKAATIYWTELWSRAQEARYLLNAYQMVSPSKLEQSIDAAVGYGDPMGDCNARIMMASALSRWYETIIKPDNILFTVGGAGGLDVVFKILRAKDPKGIILTPFPHYSLYKGSSDQNYLFPIPLMEQTGYQLTAEIFLSSLNKAIEYAEQNNTKVVAFLFCDPNNPLGTVINDVELQKIADILRENPDLLIILDEAYAELCFHRKKHISLLTIAPDLSSRIILLRSATKAFSAAGERMAVLVTSNDDLMTDLLQENINTYGHAPRSLQNAFAYAMDKLDEFELAAINKYYREQVNYVARRIDELGIAMPDKSYEVNGTFYIVCDLSEMFGLELPEITKCALNKIGKIETDEDIAYYLLFSDKIMIAPLSYYGLPSDKGWMRITCSGGHYELSVLMNRLENRVLSVRAARNTYGADISDGSTISIVD